MHRICKISLVFLGPWLQFKILPTNFQRVQAQLDLLSTVTNVPACRKLYS